MSHECHDSSCSSEHHSHHHDGECCCSCHTCACECHNHHHKKYTKELLCLADQAWMEVLKEKIKEEILKTSGKHLDQMAKLVSEANHKRWKEKLAEKKQLEDFDDDLKSLMYRSKG